MAIKVAIEWRVLDKGTNERIEGVGRTSLVNDYTEIQPKMLERLSNNYNVKDLKKDLKLQDKLGPDMDRGGYSIVELQDDSKSHDIVIVVEILSHG